MRPPVVSDFWKNLSRTTQARIALGRAGASLPTQEVLNFSLAHARARDAVHTPFDRDKVADEIRASGSRRSLSKAALQTAPAICAAPIGAAR